MAWWPAWLQGRAGPGRLGLAFAGGRTDAFRLKREYSSMPAESTISVKNCTFLNRMVFWKVFSIVGSYLREGERGREWWRVVT